MTSLAAIDVAAYGLLLWSAVVTGASITAIYRLRARLGSAPPLAPPGALRGPTRALLVRPCAGDEPLLERALSSLKDARASFDLRCRFAIADESDAALPAARRAVEALRSAGIDASIVITAASGANRKASQLAAVIEREASADADEIVLVADSDVDLAGVDLDRLTAPLSGSSGASYAWAPPFEGSPTTAADRASAALLGASLHSFPLLVGLDRSGAVGKLFAVRRSALDAAGGFGSLSSTLGEDVELARRVRLNGGSVVAAGFAVSSLARGRSWGQVIARYARWIVMIRAQRPWLLGSYPGLFFAAPILLAMSALLAPFAPVPALASAFLALGARALVAASASRACGAQGPLRLAPLLGRAFLADALLAAAFVRALRARSIAWRGKELTVDRAGVLRETAA